MSSAEPHRAFRAAEVAVLRAAAHTTLDLPDEPTRDDVLGDARVGTAWLRTVWATSPVAEALEQASPVLAEQVRTLCAAEVPHGRQTARAVGSVARYLRRMTGRATPFGLFAGVAPVSFGDQASHHWGGDHRTVTRASGAWLADVIGQLERCPQLLARLTVVANSTLLMRGDRLIVPYQAAGVCAGDDAAAMEVSLRATAAVRAAVALAHEPVVVADLCANLLAKVPAATPEKVTGLMSELVARRVLLTCLRAPSTEPDALGYLLRQLGAVDAGTVASVTALVDEIQQIHDGLTEHEAEPAGGWINNPARRRASVRMRRLVPEVVQPVAVDLRLDAATVLPATVAQEIERTALVLARLSAHPTGTAAWRAYHQRFYERYGIGSLVPVLDMVADSGIGWPDGYPGTATPEPPVRLSARDRRLLALAQQAALDGTTEVVVDDDLIASLQPDDQVLRPPSHLEIGVRLHATSLDRLRAGRFRLEVVSVSRAAGVLTGRFLNVLAAPDAARLAGVLAEVPGADADTTMVQLSFPPLLPATAHVARAPQVWPVASLAEHRPSGADVMTVRDMAVGCDGRRMFLTVPAWGRRVEATGLHALNLRRHTPPLARLLTELGRAQSAQVTRFSWGAAAELPYLPRLRSGRIILAAAQWRLTGRDIPSAAVPLAAWEAALEQWRLRRRVPRSLFVVNDDLHLPMDLDQSADRALLRDQLHRRSQVVLVEAPSPDELGWCGGRAHEIVTTVAATAPPWPTLPAPTRARLLDSQHGHAPGVSRTLLACLYGHRDRQDQVLADHLPELLARLGQPRWWLLRYRDPDHHLRLRITLPTSASFGDTAAIISGWVGELRHVELLSEVRYRTSYPETGRWGDGPAWQAAEQVFHADSTALLTQLRQPSRPPQRALVAAHTVAIAAAFTGSTEAGTRWIVDRLPATAPTAVPRPQFTEAVRLADPTGDWAALRATEGGAATVAAWKARDGALRAYRALFPSEYTLGVDPDAVLASLLHANYVRGCGIDFDDEAICRYLARAAALAFTARRRKRLP